MKKLNTIIWSLLLVGIAYGQPCSDLLISEIIFGKQGSSLNGGSPELTFDNYSVEIYNSTDTLIDLSDYKIELIATDSVETEFSLYGTIGSKETFVLSNPNASFAVASVTDTLTSFLDFEDKVLLQLTKNGDPIDVIGQQGIGDEIENINIDSLLNDPDYLQSLGLDLRSVENLTVRRRPGVQEGKKEFIVTEILQDWAIYPHFFIDDLGQHINVCTPNTIEIRWRDNTGNGTAVREGLELDLSFAGTIQGEMDNIGSPSATITASARPVSEPPLGFAEATQGQFDDFDVPDPFGNQNNEFLISPSSPSGIFVDLCEVFDDSESEPTEVATFKLEVVDDPNFEVFIGFPELFWVSILDDEPNAVVDIGLQKQVTLFPTIAQNTITISSSLDGFKINGLYLYSPNGQEEFYIRGNNLNTFSFDVSNLSRGYHTVIIYSSKGVLAKRFIKL